MFKRLSLSILAIGLVAALVAAGSYALFTANAANSDNTFTTGTVTLGTPAVTLVDVTNIVPGDSGSGDYAVEYTGSVPAWLGLDASLSGGLMTCDGGGKFTVAISDGTNSYAADAVDQVIGKFVTGQSVTLTANWALALGAGNDCQIKSAQLKLAVQAVQAQNNTNAGGTGPISW